MSGMSNWMLLSNAWARLRTGRLQQAFIDSDEVIVNALRSGAVPMRGIARFEYEQLTRELLESAQIDIMQSSASKLFSCYRNVEVNYDKLENYIIDFLLPTSFSDTLPIEVNENNEKGTMQGPEKRFGRFLKDLPDKPVRTKVSLWTDIENPKHELYRLYGAGAGELSRLGKRAFERAWRDAAPASWHRGGARPK